MKFINLVILCALALPLAGAQGNGGSEAKPKPLYIIQPNDMLEIFVWKEPDLTRKVLVRPDGRISFPLVQDIQAAGTSPADLKARVERELATFLKAPEVTIIVEAIQSYKIYVLGKVQKPGGIQVEKPVTVLQAVALAGGFQDYAKEDEMSIIRTDGDANLVFGFNYRDVIRGKNTEQNILLRSGDVVVIP
jgi:polysaccharide export outer membrane protein